MEFYGDDEPPEISLLSPEEDALYIGGEKRRSFFTTLVIGTIDVEVVAFDSETEIDKVEFYLDGQLQESVEIEPFIWTWNTKSFFIHTLSVIAYDFAGHSTSDELRVWKLF